MSHLVQRSLAYHQAGAATAVPAAYAATNTVQPARPANTARFSCTLAWTVIPTSITIILAWSADGGATWTPCSVVNSVVAGVVDLGDGVFDMVLTEATHEICVGVPTGADLRLQAQMVDPGGADPIMIAWVVLTDE